MTEAPERIWADMEDRVFFADSGRPEALCIEYIRADLHQAALDRIAALEAQVKAADALADDVGKMEQWAAELGFSGGRIGAALAAYHATKEASK